MAKTKQVQCNYSGCGDRRSNYENPEPRGKPLMVEVPDDHDGPVYCSFECAIYDGAYSAKTGWIDRKGGRLGKAKDARVSGP